VCGGAYIYIYSYHRWSEVVSVLAIGPKVHGVQTRPRVMNF
jgi:hypothetical protein